MLKAVDLVDLNKRCPLVSVIIPAYNSGIYLEQAIESVHQQTFEDWELIIVDDGSTDDIAATCSKYPRVTLIRQEKSGVSIARNVGILNSTGQFIAFLDHDDIWQPTKLVKQLAALNVDSSIGICHTDVSFIDAEGKQLDPQKRTPLIPAHRNTIVHALTESVEKNYESSGILTSSSVAIRRSALASGGLFDPGLDICGDTDLWLKICLRHKLAYVPSRETIYRLHEGNLSKNMSGRDELELLSERFEAHRVRTGLREAATVVRKLKLEAPRHFAAQRFDRCRKSFRNRQPLTAIRELVTATKLDPRFVAQSIFLWFKLRL